MNIDDLLCLDFLSLRCRHVSKPEVILIDITNDSRSSGAGIVYCSTSLTLKSLSFHKECIEDALHREASLIICENQEFAQNYISAYPKTIFLTYLSDVVSPTQVLTRLLTLFYPRKPTFLAAVTGTNGKSSLVEFTRQILGKLGHRVASFGTLGLLVENFDLETIDAELSRYSSTIFLHTTYDLVTFHKLSHKLAEAGITHLVLEASSIGLSQGRLEGVLFDVGVFTHLTRDHLDYHESMDDYFEAKSILFKRLMKPSGLVLFSDRLSSTYAKRLSFICNDKNLKVWTYGQGGGSDLKYDIKESEVKLSFCDSEFTFPVSLQQFHRFQIENLSGAIGVVLAAIGHGGSKNLPSTTLDKVKLTLDSLKTIRGRAELVDVLSNGGRIFVDYAHSPDALQTVLTELREMIKGNGKLRVVVGCGGQRDVGKRKFMGQVCRHLADHIIITDDNSRNEDPASIRKYILQGAHDGFVLTNMDSEARLVARSSPHFIEIEEIGDRRSAICRGIKVLTSHDILLIAGKGHETTQIIGDVSIPFNDANVVHEVLRCM